MPDSLAASIKYLWHAWCVFNFRTIFLIGIYFKSASSFVEIQINYKIQVSSNELYS